MAIKQTERTSISKAISRANASTYYTVDNTVDGYQTLDAEQYNLLHDLNNPPFGLGDGVSVGTSGIYLMPPTEDPVIKFVLVNGGPDDMMAGINAEVSGEWLEDNTLLIPSGQSYEFGDWGTQIIRNVWAVSDGDSLALGYATRQKTTV